VAAATDGGKTSLLTAGGGVGSAVGEKSIWAKAAALNPTVARTARKTFRITVKYFLTFFMMILLVRKKAEIDFLEPDIRSFAPDDNQLIFLISRYQFAVFRAREKLSNSSPAKD
jgi:hypothetical protein